MTVLLVLLAWAVASATLALLWIGYRHFVGTHSMDEFDTSIGREWTQALYR